MSGGDVEGTLSIDQDAQVYVSSLEAGSSVTHPIRQGHRHAYLFVIAGEVTVNGQALSAGDQARIADESSLNIATRSNAELILLDLP